MNFMNATKTKVVSVEFWGLRCCVGQLTTLLNFLYYVETAGKMVHSLQNGLKHSHLATHMLDASQTFNKLLA